MNWINPHSKEAAKVTIAPSPHMKAVTPNRLPLLQTPIAPVPIPIPNPTIQIASDQSETFCHVVINKMITPGGYRVKKSFTCCTNTSRPISLIASVNGSCFGQACTQFCAKPHS